MRFTAAIHQIVAREARSAPMDDVPQQRADESLPFADSQLPLLSPPPLDLDQRVRLTGEW
jgi:hypothetical protein